MSYFTSTPKIILVPEAAAELELLNAQKDGRMSLEEVQKKYLLDIELYTAVYKEMIEKGFYDEESKIVDGKKIYYFALNYRAKARLEELENVTGQVRAYNKKRILTTILIVIYAIKFLGPKLYEWFRYY